MMDISKMSDERKSVLLAKAMGWHVIDEGDFGVPFFEPETGLSGVTLYDPANMALAWRGLNWALEQTAITDIQGIYWHHDELESVLWDFVRWQLWEPDNIKNAQRLWLDKVLELAIEAGIVKEE